LRNRSDTPKSKNNWVRWDWYFFSSDENIFETKKDATIMKTRMFSGLLLGLSIALTVLAAARQAQATLGESVDSVASDRKALSTMQGTTTISPGYTIHEVRSETTIIREYISPSGVVFGIAWNGLTHPDLTPLLGSYTYEYQNALRQIPRQPGRRHVQVKTDRVIVEKWGHMRNLQGRAYAPALIPQGISIDEIK
jgi:hypothetical protein